MADLKLCRLPDRVPVKLTITVPPDLHKALQIYAELYRTTYGDDESIQTLIPFMLRNFLDADRGFAKASKVRSTTEAATGPATRPRRVRARATTETSPNLS
ncbi:MAG: DUF2274 domain-containing protein [Alphaproteobacteria bacterium]|nr:DUF2274 domain-containing protein [Alphaproteobacteria bacterium]MDE2352842.1 DUF2274 domain-containing protein [Alphaproteobacteria bacterium]